MRIFLVTLLLVFLASPSKTEAPDHLDPFEAFQLWTDCQPVYLIVTLQKHKTEIDLTKEAIEIATRSRLRSARLYTEEWSGTFLFVSFVSVDVYYPVFSIDVDLVKPLVDLKFSGKEFSRTTWSNGSNGEHSNDANYILSAVSQLIDTFLDEYLRVNADSC